MQTISCIDSPTVPIVGARIVFICWSEHYRPFGVISKYSPLLHLLVELIVFDDAGKVIHIENVTRWIVDQAIVEVTNPKYVTAWNDMENGLLHNILRIEREFEMRPKM